MSKIFLFILSAAIVAPVSAQTDTGFQFVRKISGDIQAFTIDNLDNIYILNSRNQLKKLNSNGDSVAIFNDVRRFGKATIVDVSNPLKVLLYYKDFATIIMLDRFLNMVNTVDLRKSNVLQAKAIGQSYDNKIWVYDELENKLKKIGEDGKLLQETPDFRLLFDATPQPQKIFDENQYVYLYDSTHGVSVFDYYGALKNNVLIYNWQNFKVAGNYIFGSKADSLYRYDIRSFQYDEWKKPEPIRDAGSFNFSGTRLYALRTGCDGKDNCILVYAIR
jgi:hypothetical protein